MKVVVGGRLGLRRPRARPSLLGRRARGGRRLAAAVAARHARVLGRRSAAEVDGADAVVNLAGARSAAGAGPAAARRRSSEPRRHDPRLVAGDRRRRRAPRVLVTASGIGWDGDAGDVIVDEASPAGHRFPRAGLRRLGGGGRRGERASRGGPHRVRRRPWRRRAQAHGAALPPVRRRPARRRAAVVPVDSPRGHRPPLPAGDRRRVARRAAERASRPSSCASARPRRVFGKVLHRPAVVPTPAFALRALLGEQADLVLHGQRAVSRKLDGSSSATGRCARRSRTRSAERSLHRRGLTAVGPGPPGSGGDRAAASRELLAELRARHEAVRSPATPTSSPSSTRTLPRSSTISGEPTTSVPS